MVEDLFGEIPVTKDDIEKWMEINLFRFNSLLLAQRCFISVEFIAKNK